MIYLRGYIDAEYHNKRGSMMDKSYNSELSSEEIGHEDGGLVRKSPVIKHEPCPVCGFGRLLDSSADIITDILVATSFDESEKNGWKPDFFAKCPKCKNEFGYRRRGNDALNTSELEPFVRSGRVIFIHPKSGNL